MHTILQRVNVRYAVLFYVLTFVNMAFASCTSEGTFEVDDKHSIVKVSDKLPEFAVILNDGTTLSTSSLTGKPSVVIFFRTTCPDCQKELPIIQTLYETYTSDVNFICISRAEGNDSVSTYWKEHGLTLPYSSQEDRTVYNLFATQTIPRVYVADASLTVRSVFVEKASEKALRKAISALLR